MRVTVRLLGGIRSPLGEAGPGPVVASLTLPDGAAVTDLLRRLPIPAGDEYTTLLNGRHAERCQVLRDGDEVSVFPAAGGG